MQDLELWLKKCEGYRSHPYLDTKKIVTIGYGRNLDDNGISEDEAELMLQNDIKKAKTDLATCHFYINQPEHVQLALINMCFNMGLPRLLEFHGMIAALERNDYTTAAQEALDSLWAKEVGQRAKDVALMMRQGF
jgi:lysozyme